jgi:hypothetical protein
MKRLALILVLAATSCGSSGGGGGPASFAATWSITVAGVPVDCSALSSETVEIDFTRHVNGHVEPPFLFNCSDGLGHVVSPSGPVLVQDAYDVTITLWNNYDLPADRVNLASATISVVLVGGISQLPTFAFTPSFGAFDLAWTIVNNTGGPDTCAAVGADTFEWTVTNTTTSLVDTFLYDCADMAALTNNPPLPFGNYSGRARLKGGTQTLGEALVPSATLNSASLQIPTLAFTFN